MSTAELMRGVQAISFDLDDTLWDCDSVIRQAEQQAWQWLTEHTPRITEQHERDIIGQLRREIVDKEPHLVTDVTRLRHTIYKELLIRHDYHSELADQLFNVFYIARSNVTLYDGVLNMLDSIRQHFKVAAITNGNADLSIVGIDGHFADVQRASVDNPPKPDAHMFEQCMKNLDLTSDRLIHIGDNPETDVCGAKRAGLKAIWFNQTGATWPSELDPPDIEANSIDHLTQLLLVNT
ncbi:MAG: HAD-IA family hydrolase [Gammaproteobacteria bacterium]|nr:HAD-IA family hydrolase [Gammaproteobacteria bacterium]